ncbi:TadE/TadG family type IV pilus assembly protein [Vibrio sagamiensis]|uniref:TadE-like domain-containing protein n=1 Tax=Vibrio sagamiensis NBRC 104589 TaxID=1219064 RepID=A0A511QEJ7_9VIBR|nr:TadE family protein [Vibrio sagamiensis]PNQ67655.1 pilus assembly protein [Vibrio agarivorans]GEM75721.1 hypothetical protein VSA01S_18330 [Vibrio sagamiensis NBRC 104589]
MLSNQKGAQSVEFAMIVLPFLLLSIGFFEICRLLLVHLLFDVAINAGARDVKTRLTSPVSEQVFIEAVAKFPLIEKNNITLLDTLYAKSFSDLLNNKQAPKNQAQLGEYNVHYAFSFALLPSLSIFLSKPADDKITFKKKVLVSYEK